MEKGDKVEVIEGSYKGAKGTVVGITYSFEKKIITVEPNEHADNREFWETDLKVINE